MRVYLFLALTMFMAYAPVHAQQANWCESNSALYSRLSALQRSGRELTAEQSSFVEEYFNRCVN
jgi:hypothetical protein